MKEKREGGAMKRTLKPVSSALSKAGSSRKINRRGFSLAEVLIVVAVIAVLVGIAIPVFAGQLEKNRDSVTATNLRAAYDEANATLLSRGQKPPAESAEPEEITVTVDGVAFETTDNKLSGEETSLPFTIPDTVTIPAKNTYSVVFHFTNQNTYTNKTYITLGEAAGGSDPIPTPMPSPSTGTKKTVTDISIVPNTVKTIYNEGEAFDQSGMKLTVTYSDNSTAEIETGYSCSNVGPYPIAGSYTVTVRYEGKTAPLTITVNKRTVTELVIDPDSPQPKTEYTEGEPFDPGEMVVNAKYSDGTWENDVAYTYRPIGELKASDTFVTLSYEGVTTKLTIKVTKPDWVLKRIEISGVSATCDAQEFDDNLSNLIVTAYYKDKDADDDDGEEYPIKLKTYDYDKNITPEPKDPPEAGIYTLTVSYSEDDGQPETDDLEITVTRSFSDIQIDRAPTNPQYQGKPFDPEGMVVNAYYTDGTFEPVTDYTVEPSGNLTQIGEQTVKIKWGEKEAPLVINVIKSITELEIRNVAAEYDAAEFDPALPTMEVWATFSDGTEGKITEGYTAKFEPEITTTPPTAGNYTLTVKCGDGEDQKEIKITKKMTGILVTNYKDEYTEGEAFSTDGMVVTPVYSDNSPGESISGYDYEPKGPLAVDDTKVTVTYNDFTYDCPIKVNGLTWILDHIELSEVAETCDALEFEDNLACLVVTAYYKDKDDPAKETHHTVAVDLCEKSVSPHNDPPLAGTYTLTVTYEEGGERDTKTLDIVVTKALAYIKIDPSPTNPQYQGFPLDTTGMKVIAHYTDETDEPVEIAECTITPSGNLTGTSSQTVKVEWGGKDDTAEITVNTVKSVQISGLPNKCDAKEFYDKLNLLKVEATYSNNETKTITEGYTPSWDKEPANPPLAGEYNLTVSFGEKSSNTLKIEVTKSEDHIAITRMPTTDYTEGDYFWPWSNNLEVTLYYTDGSPKTLSYYIEYECEPSAFEPLTTDDTYVTITYKDLEPIILPINVSPKSGGGICFAPGTLITLSDGTQKPVEELTFDDELLVWDFKTGMYAAESTSLIINHGEHTYAVISLKFSDGTLFRIVGEHGIFDYDLNQFVYITPEIALDYIGHRFVKYASEDSYDLVTLVSAEVTEEWIEAWSVVSSYDFNVFASNLLTLSPPAEVFNFMPMGETLRYDMERFRQLVTEYGTYDYEVFAPYFTEEQYEGLNSKYLKVFVELGILSYEEMCEMAEFISPLIR